MSFDTTYSEDAIDKTVDNVTSAYKKDELLGKGTKALTWSSLPFLQSFDEVVRGVDIPEYLREHKTTLRFPEMLLLLIMQVEREATKRGPKPANACLAWTGNGKAIIVCGTKELTHKLLPLASCQAKFSSLVRRLYRWGFRQASNDALGTNHQDDKVKEKLFCHPLFQRDNKPLIEGMRSITAEGTRRAIAAKHLIDMQETRLLEQLSNHEHIQELDQSPPSPNLFPLASTTDARFAPAARLEQRLGSTTATPVHVRPGVHMLRVETVATPNSVRDDLCWSSIMNRQRGLAAAPATAAAAPAEVTGALGLLPFHTPFGCFLSSPFSGHPFLSSGNLEMGNIFDLSRPDLVDPSMNERSMAALHKILGPPAVSWRESLLRSIVEQNHQQKHH